MFEYSFLSLFLAGLLGGGHCAAMCGGVVGALSMPGRGAASLGQQLLFNLGRIGSYMLVGAIAGTIGNSTQMLAQAQTLQLALYGISSLILIGLGLYVAGISSAITQLEKLGRPVWRQLQPLTRKLLPIRHAWQALAIGGLWGWLPCGLVYTATLSALSSARPLQGALLMLAFGAGTLPNLMLLGMAARHISGILQNRWWKLFAGATIAGFGLLGMYRLCLLLGAR